MILNPDQENYLFFLNTNRDPNDGNYNNYNGLITDSAHLWPYKGKVPYELTGDHSEAQTDMIMRAMEAIQNVSCVKFVKRLNQRHFMQLTVSLQFLII